MDRRYARAAYEARRRALDLEQMAAQGWQADAVVVACNLYRLHFRGLFHADPRARCRDCAWLARRLGDLLGLSVCVGNLRQCGLPARAGMQIHVPLRTL